jgi:hypothetical protein
VTTQKNENEVRPNRHGRSRARRAFGYYKSALD